MANIHILEGNLYEKKGTIQTGTFQIAYHIPIDNPNSSLTFSNFSSIVPDITTEENNSLQSGTLFEIIRSDSYNSLSPDSEYITLLKYNWSSIRKIENIKYNFRTKYYLTKLNI